MAKGPEGVENLRESLLLPSYAPMMTGTCRSIASQAPFASRHGRYSSAGQRFGKVKRVHSRSLPQSVATVICSWRICGGRTACILSMTRIRLGHAASTQQYKCIIDAG
jgi:hypothetical protein